MRDGESAGKRLTVVTLADERYALPLAVLGRSLSENIRSGVRAMFYVVDGGISAETKRRLIASWHPERLQVEFIPPQFGQEREFPVFGRLTALTYARVFVPFLLPKECGKAIFLDSDTVILTDISRLWNIEIGEHYLLAVQDPAVPFVSARDGLKRYRELGIPAEQEYFNAGVMVVDLDKWRSSNVPEQVMNFIRRNAAELSYCDQDALNAILFNKWRSLDPRWQVQPRFVVRNHLPLPHINDGTRMLLTADPWILHFSGRLKPWIYRGVSLPDRIFYQYLDRTWWSGWRPSHTIKAWMYRVYDSRLRDWCYPVEQRALGVLRNLTRRSARI